MQPGNSFSPQPNTPEQFAQSAWMLPAMPGIEKISAGILRFAGVIFTLGVCKLAILPA